MLHNPPDRSFARRTRTGSRRASAPCTPAPPRSWRRRRRR